MIDNAANGMIVHIQYFLVTIYIIRTDTMSQRSIKIIGAGIAGLSAGCYAQMNGYQSTIYEMHTIPGGLCTSWRRGDYTFDGCLDWLTGSSPDGMFYPIWNEVGVLEKRSFINHDSYCDYLSEDGKTIRLYFHPDKLKQELLRLAPEDKEGIDELCGLIRTFIGFKPYVQKPQELFSALDYMKMMPDMMVHLKQYRAFLKYGKISMREFGAKMRSPLLKSMLEHIWGESFPVSLFAATMAWCAAGTAGYPEGGSLKVALAMEKRYIALGGHIEYKSRVEEILTENGKAAGVRLADGTEHRADVVISAADGYTTLNRMLGGRFTSQAVQEWYETNPTFPPYVQVSLGVARDMGGGPKLTHRRLRTPITAAGVPVPYLIIQNYACDKTLAPAGKTPLAVRFFTDYDYWMQLYADIKRYKAEKDKLAQDVISELAKLYPGIERDIDVIDVATPATYVRYTGTWKGATMSWLPTTANFNKSIGKTLPGLAGFYMCGQWLVPGGGVPNALKTGRDVVQLICKDDKKRFVTMKAQNSKI